MDIVQEALVNNSDPSAPSGSRPNMHNLQRITNRQHEKPDLHNHKILILRFRINNMPSTICYFDYLPDNFVRKDVRVGFKAPHYFSNRPSVRTPVIFQNLVHGLEPLKLLENHLCKLFSIHVFLKSGDDTKQVPAAFCMMSSRTKKDYKKILKKLLKLLPRIANSK
ncbi:hypothetical protein KUTeg_001938, partial [Tegillarca granosa]